MKSALLMLRETVGILSNTEQEVASYLLAHPQEIVDLSIHELAKRTFSSSSTIVRLCHRLGFEGFKEFRKMVTYELAMRERNQKAGSKELDRSDSLDEIVEKITYKNIMSLEDTKNLMDMQVLQECLRLIQNARYIYLFGVGASLCAAKDAYLKFLRLNKPCVINEDWHSQLLQAYNATSQDLGLVISYSGNTVEVIECMKALKENGTPIIAITRCVNTPVSELADQKLYTTANESTFRSGAMSSRISQLNIIDILYTALANSRYDQSLQQLARTHIHKPTPPKG